MKKNKLLFGALALLAFTACSDDKSIMEEPVTGDDTFAYIKVNLLSAGLNGGKATTNADFELGEGVENEISNLVMIFYGAQGNYLSSASMAANEITLEDANNDEANNVELIKSAKAKVSLSGGTIPSYMIIYANPINPDDIKWSMNTIHTQTRESYKGQNGKFAMNNSVYFGYGTHVDIKQNSDAKNIKDLQRAVVVSKENFYKTDNEASTAKEVNVYLERVAAKVTLHGATKNTELGSQEGTIDGKKLNFVVDGWGLNAEAKKCFLSKNLSLGDDFVETFAAIDNQLKQKFEYWNEPDKYRSYWAIALDYKVPTTVSNVTVTGDKKEYKYPYVSDQAGDKNILNYHSFNDFAKGGKNHVEVGNATYTMENTRHSDLYSTDFKNSGLISAVVVGHYTVDGKETDFYVQGEKIYLEKDYLTAMAKAANVIVKADGSVLTEADEAKLSEVLEIHHPTVPNVGDASKGVEENLVTVRIKGTKDDKTYAPDYTALADYKFKDGSKDAEAISATNIERINQILYNNCGLTAMYKGGKAYFNIPIRHLADEPAEGEACPPAYYGVVRNHSYNISVDGFAPLAIATLGKGVRDPEDPIVPPTDPSDKFGIKAKIRVLSWRLVKQNVTLGQ